MSADPSSSITQLSMSRIDNDAGTEVTFTNTIRDPERVVQQHLILYFKARGPEENRLLTSIRHRVRVTYRKTPSVTEERFSWTLEKARMYSRHSTGRMYDPSTGAYASAHNVQDVDLPLSEDFDGNAITVGLATIPDGLALRKFLAHYLPRELGLRESY